MQGMPSPLAPVHIVGGGLAGSECAFQLASRGVPVVLHEMRPVRETPAPKGGHFAAFEQPALFVDDVRAFFRKLR